MKLNFDKIVELVEENKNYDFAIDVSGGMPDGMFEEMIAVVKNLVREKKIKGRVITFDGLINHIYDVNDVTIMPYNGGGGTDFNRVIDFSNMNRSAKELFIFTDGYGNVYKDKPTYNFISFPSQTPKDSIPVTFLIIGENQYEHLSSWTKIITV